MFNPRIRVNNNDLREIFDPVRKKYVKLTPEEWVRQNIIYFLYNVKHVPYHLMGVEKQLYVNKMPKRPDIIAFYPSGKVFLIVECKAESIKLDNSTFDQVLRYNMPLNSKYLMLTNLKSNFCVEITDNSVKPINLDQLVFEI